MFGQLPLGTLMSGIATVLVVVFFVTSGDSAVLVLGTMSTGGRQDPGARVKIAWGLLIAGVAASLLMAGGLKSVQTATIVFALPFTVVIVLNIRSRVVGMVVDAVSEVLDIPAADIEPPPAFGTRIRRDFIAGMGKVRERFVILLNAEHALALDELNGLDAPPEAAACAAEALPA